MHETLEAKGTTAGCGFWTLSCHFASKQVALSSWQGKLPTPSPAIAVIDIEIAKERTSSSRTMSRRWLSPIARSTIRATAGESRRQPREYDASGADRRGHPRNRRHDDCSVEFPDRQVMEVVPEGAPMEIEATC